MESGIAASSSFLDILHKTARENGHFSNVLVFLIFGLVFVTFLVEIIPCPSGVWANVDGEEKSTLWLRHHHHHHGQHNPHHHHSFALPFLQMLPDTTSTTSSNKRGSSAAGGKHITTVPCTLASTDLGDDDEDKANHHDCDKKWCFNAFGFAFLCLFELGFAGKQFQCVYLSLSLHWNLQTLPQQLPYTSRGPSYRRRSKTWWNIHPTIFQGNRHHLLYIFSHLCFLLWDCFQFIIFIFVFLTLTYFVTAVYLVWSCRQGN